LNRGAEQAALQRDAQQFFEQGGPLSAPEQFQRQQLQRFQPLPVVEEDWHQQFQRVTLSNFPAPQQFMTPNQLGKQPESHSSPPWQDEFTRFQNPPPKHFSYQPQVQHRLATLPYASSVSYEQQTIQQPGTQDAIFDDEAFELAFAQVEKALQPAVVVEPEPIIEEEPKLSAQEEADRLAQTAGELFDKLQHERDTNEKFRNSTFMALMKKLRDREVVVSGNEMVEISTLSKSESKDHREDKEFGFQELQR